MRSIGISTKVFLAFACVLVVFGLVLGYAVVRFHQVQRDTRLIHQCYVPLSLSLSEAHTDIATWWGPGEAGRAVTDRMPDGVLLADEEALILHRFSDDRMIGNHGGLSNAEREVPLLLATSNSVRASDD